MVVIALPPIRPKGAPIDWSSDALSSRTAFATLTVGEQSIGQIALNPSNKHCLFVSVGLSCTIVATVKPARKKQIEVQTFATGVTLPLALGHITANLYRGRNVVAMSMRGIARKLKIVPSAKTLHRGQYVLDTIQVKALDAARAEIPDTRVIDPGGYALKVSLAFSGFRSARAELHGNPLVDTFQYDGFASGTETIDANVRNVNTQLPPASTTLTVVPGNSDFAPLIMGIAVPGPEYGKPVKTIGEFSLTVASSSSVPARQFINPHRIPGSYRARTDWSIFGGGTDGSFWIGNVHYSNTLSVLGTVTLPPNVPFPSAIDSEGHLYGWDPVVGQCALYEFPSGYGSLSPIREIDGPCGENVVIDAAGNVYDAGQFFVPSQTAPVFGVQEYPATGSGNIAPIRQMVVSTNDDLVGAGFLSLDIDDAGNVYVAAQTSESDSGQIYMFAPGQTTGTVQLGGLQVLGFAVDGAGDIYAAIPTSSNSSSSEVEEFTPGATTPIRSFSGTDSYGLPILVPR
ncbi:MAG TPA: hypothetical protein VFE36_00980 [Candidatus Baltobacteraceae bacterium]|nr:hypothetical protein [Candidatus Baltobacteraceae bacterium]